MPAGTTASATPPPPLKLPLPLHFAYHSTTASTGCKTEAKWRRTDCVRKLQENAGNACREWERGGRKSERERERQLEEVQSSASKTTAKIANEKENLWACSKWTLACRAQLSNVPQYALLAQLRCAAKAFRTCVHSKHSQCAALSVYTCVCVCVCQQAMPLERHSSCPTSLSVCCPHMLRLTEQSISAHTHTHTHKRTHTCACLANFRMHYKPNINSLKRSTTTKRRSSSSNCLVLVSS